jgi:hypothetical protein
MPSYLLLAFVLVVPIAFGAASGLLAAHWFLSRHSQPSSAAEVPTDPFVSAEIDQAAVRWATASGRPEAAGLMADKLHMLHRLGQRRRRWRS